MRVAESIREIGKTTEREPRFYPASLAVVAGMPGRIVRSHYAIENSQQQLTDMVFGGEECRVRTDHTPGNFCTIQHIAQKLIRVTSGKIFVRVKKKTARWDISLTKHRSADDVFQGLGFRRTAHPFFQPLQHHEERRHKQYRETSGGEHSGQHADPQGNAGCCASAG